MRTMARGIGITITRALFALALYTLLVLPGLVSDRDSTVPLHAIPQVQR